VTAQSSTVRHVDSVTVAIRDATSADQRAIAALYNQGIAERQATLETRPRAPGEMVAWFEPDPQAACSRPTLRAGPFTAPSASRTSRAASHGRIDGEWKDCGLVERLLGDAARS
jgi:hypothetical protein